MPPAAAARSDAYFAGGYWLLLWGTLVSLLAAWILLRSGVSARLRDLAMRLTRRAGLQVLLYAAGIIVLVSLLELPWSIYAEFVREHQYGLTTQRFGAWLGEAGVALAVSVALFAPALALLYALIRRTGRAWWAWSGALFAALAALGLLIAPVFIEPLFNDYTPLPGGPLREEILALARANGVPSDDVFVVDASRQTTRISANVAGLLGTTRIALNDNLLAQCTPAEIRAVLGHEIGHYVLGHAFTLLVALSLVFGFGALLADRAFAALMTRYGVRWGVLGLTDPAGLPVLYALLSVYLLLATPVLNTLIRVNEAQADLFGLNAAREPDAFASVALKLSSYRKLAPGPWEEALLFDHPSGLSRISMAMTWKAEQGRSRSDAP